MADTQLISQNANKMPVFKQTWALRRAPFLSLGGSSRNPGGSCGLPDIFTLPTWYHFVNSSEWTQTQTHAFICFFFCFYLQNRIAFLLRNICTTNIIWEQYFLQNKIHVSKNTLRIVQILFKLRLQCPYFFCRQYQSRISISSMRSLTSFGHKIHHCEFRLRSEFY